MPDNQEEGFLPHSIEWDAVRAKRLWDYYGTSEAHRSTYFGETCGRHFVRFLRRHGYLRGKRAIVDFSCGTGAIIEAILAVVPSSTKVRGYDPSIRSVEKAISRNLGRSGFEGAEQIETYPTNLASGSVDLLILTEVVEHLDDVTLASVFSEIHRVLAPGGTLVLTTPNDECLERAQVRCPECGCTFHRWQHQRTWSMQSLTAYLQSSGFSLVKVRSVTWGDELIDLAFWLLGRKKTGLLAVAFRG